MQINTRFLPTTGSTIRSSGATGSGLSSQACKAEVTCGAISDQAAAGRSPPAGRLTIQITMIERMAQ